MMQCCVGTLSSFQCWRAIRYRSIGTLSSFQCWRAICRRTSACSSVTPRTMQRYWRRANQPRTHCWINCMRSLWRTSEKCCRPIIPRPHDYGITLITTSNIISLNIRITASTESANCKREFWTLADSVLDSTMAKIHICSGTQCTNINTAEPTHPSVVQCHVPKERSLGFNMQSSNQWFQKNNLIGDKSFSYFTKQCSHVHVQLTCFYSLWKLKRSNTSMKSRII